jgi:hypothetical protein
MMPVMRAVFLGVLLAVTSSTMREVAADPGHNCREDEKDARGDCPTAKAQPKTTPTPKASPTQPKAPKQPVVKPTKLDIHSSDAHDAGAQVSVDGVPSGQLPLVVDATPGRHLVEVAKDGYAPFSLWVTVASGDVSGVAVVLAELKTQPDPVVPPSSPTQPPDASVQVVAPPENAIGARKGLTGEIGVGFGYGDEGVALAAPAVAIGGFITPTLALTFRVSTRFARVTDPNNNLNTETIFTVVAGPSVQYWFTKRVWASAGLGLAVDRVAGTDSDVAFGFGFDARVGYSLIESEANSLNVSAEVTPVDIKSFGIAASVMFGYQRL